MKTEIKHLLWLLVIITCALPLQAADYGTFESFYEVPPLSPWEWAAIIVGTIAVAAFAFVTFGGGAAAAPAWMATVGSWIGSTAGLSGAAASNFGLALLGGGATAAGGLGVAGGVAVLTAAMDLSVGVAGYATSAALEQWDRAKYIEANKDMMTLPLPRNSNGGDAYEETMEYLEENYNKDLPISDAKNQDILRQAANKLQKDATHEDDEEYALKNRTLLALLYLQQNEYVSAYAEAQRALQHASNAKEESTLAAFIWSLAQLADSSSRCTNNVLQGLRIAYTQEPDNDLMPIMTACCMDRLMYRYHYGQLSIDHLSNFFRTITDSSIKKKHTYATVEIYVTRCLVELRRTKEDIRIIAQDKNMMMQSEVISEVHARISRHRQLIHMMQTQILPYLLTNASDFPKESKLRELNLAELLYKYHEDIANLERQIPGNQSYSPYFGR